MTKMNSESLIAANNACVERMVKATDAIGALKLANKPVPEELLDQLSDVYAEMKKNNEQLLTMIGAEAAAAATESSKPSLWKRLFCQ